MLMGMRLPSFERASEKDPPRLKVHLLSPEKRRQIVRSKDSTDRRVQDKAYLSDRNRSFAKESRAKKTDPFVEDSRGGNQSAPSVQDLALSDLNSAGSTHPLKKVAKAYAGGRSSSSNDHLEDVPLGDVTQLNTVEYKYYGFYHRIRQKLEQFWGRNIHEKAQEFLQGGRYLASGENLITSLRITLDAEGEIIGITLMGTSGVKELDDAAIDSFNEAGPFPNPPKDLLVNGKVTIEWGFVVQT
jgi:TonB family protein